jgi:nucleoid-associated protein YgaU
MFLETSRYFNQPIVDAINRDGKSVKALSLRRLPPISGNSLIVKGNDRLDIIAQRQYNNPTQFWHIADANTDLEANHLVQETLRVILVPQQ